MRRIFLFPFFLAVAFTSFSQNLNDTIISIPFVSLSYSPQIPGGDFAKRFGFTNNIGLNVGIKTANNWLFELEGNFLFSKNVKEDSILNYIRTSEGYIISASGDAVNVLIYQRGFTETILVGKVIPFKTSNKNSGLALKFGVGFMHHKIKIENQDNNVPALTKENLVYVDRLTMGLSLKQFIGYQQFSNNKRINFNIGLELTEGFTQGMRDWQMNYGVYRDKRFDFLIGIRAGWFLPIYRKAPEEYYLD